jgi:hypothetical protein
VEPEGSTDVYRVSTTAFAVPKSCGQMLVGSGGVEAY